MTRWLTILTLALFLTCHSTTATPATDGLQHFLASLHCGKLKADGPMTIVPVVATSNAADPGVVTFSQALATGQLRLHGATAENTSGHTLFGMAGQPLGKVCNLHDVLVAPHQSVTLDTFVNWARLPELGDERNTFARMPDEVPDMCGAILLVNAGLTVADIFPNRKLLRLEWPLLLDDYLQKTARDCHGPLPNRNLSAQLADELLGRARRGTWQAAAARGSSRLELSGLTRGEALMNNSEPLHLRLYIGDERN